MVSYDALRLAVVRRGEGVGLVINLSTVSAAKKESSDASNG